MDAAPVEDVQVDNASNPDVIQPGSVEVEPSDWRAEAGVQDNPAFERFNSSASLAQSYTELERSLHNQIRFPSEDAGAEDVQKFQDKMADNGYYATPNMDDADGVRAIQHQLGLPKEAGAYKFEQAEGGFSNPESEGAFKTVAHEMGMTQNQASGVHKWLTDSINQQQDAIKTDQDRALGELKGRWGAAFEHKINAASNTAKVLGDKVPGLAAAWASMQEAGAFDPMFVQLMDVAGEMLGESGAMPSDPRHTMTKDEARSRIDEIQSNTDHPANSANRGNRGYDEARVKLMELYRLAG